MDLFNRYKRQNGWVTPKESKWLTPLLVYVLPLGAIVASAYGTNLVKNHQPLSGHGVIALAAIVTLSIQRWRQNQSAEREALRSKHLKRFNHKFKSIIDPLSDLFESNHSDSDANTFIRSILNSGGNLFAHDDLRLIIYQLEEGEALNGGPQRTLLQLVGCGGRGDTPRRGFESGTAEGDWAIAVAKGSGAHAITHVPPDDPRFNKLESSTWESFMAFPIRHNLNNLGVLMVDSQTKTRWTHEDQAVGTSIALIVAIGMNLLNPGADDTKPEIEALKNELKRIKESQGTHQVP